MRLTHVLYGDLAQRGTRRKLNGRINAAQVGSDAKIAQLAVLEAFVALLFLCQAASCKNLFVEEHLIVFLHISFAPVSSILGVVMLLNFAFVAQDFG